MRITAKVTLGFGLLILIFVGVHLYQSYLISRMLDAQEEVSEVRQARLTVSRIERELRILEEYSVKTLSLPSWEVYPERFTSSQALVSEEFETLLRQTWFDPGLRDVAQGVLRRWNECSELLEGVDTTEESSGKGEDSQALGLQIEGSFDRLLEELARLAEAGETSVADAESRARLAAETVTAVSRTALPLSLLLAVLLSFLVYRSIYGSLAPLLRGTQAIASGDFSIRVKTARKDELSELASVLNRMVQRLGELDKLKKDFVSHVSHDLRAPLASIEETTRLMLEDLSANLNDTQRHLLELNLSSTRRLSKMIGNLLDLSRLEAGAMAYDFEKSGVKTLLEEAATNLHGLLFEKKLRLEVRSPEPALYIRADRLRMVQVLENLLSNAIEFSPPSGRIVLAAEALRGAGGYAGAPACRISVSDEGPGIPPHQRAQVFEEFYTAPGSGKARRGGAGLGLAIARKIVDAHGGRIEIENNPEGRGTRFSLILATVRGFES